MVKKLRLKIRPTSTNVSHYLGIFVANGDFIELKSWIKFWVKISGICQQIEIFVISKDNPNVSFLLRLPWLQSIDAKLFIKKKEIYISNVKKEEIVFQIFCSTTSSKNT